VYQKARGSRRRLAVLAVVAVTAAAMIVTGTPATMAYAGAPAYTGSHDPQPTSGAGTPSGADAAVDAVRAGAARRPAPAAATTSYQVSPAVGRFLSEGLGLPVTSGLLTGLRPDRGPGMLRAEFSTGPALRYSLPDGVRAPAFTGTTVSVDTASDTLTVTAAADRDSLSVRVAHASSSRLAGGQDLTSRIGVRVGLFGGPVALSGELTYGHGTGGVALTGTLQNPVVLQAGVAVLAKGTGVSLTTGGGLRLAGTADLGPAAHHLRVGVNGRLQRTDTWSLAIGDAPARVSAVLAGLSLNRTMTGTLTGRSGQVRYDVHAMAAGTWPALPGVSVSGASVRLGNVPPPDGLMAAPGLADATPWLDVTGDVALAAGAAGTVATHGTIAVNLATGAAALTAAQDGALRLSAAPSGVVLKAARFGGLLTVGRDGIRGSVGGTGQLTVTPAGGRPATASASLGLSPAGALVAVFPANRASLGLGASRTLDTGYWAAAAVQDYPGPGARVDLPAGISVSAQHSTALLRAPATAKASPAASATDGSSTYTLSPAAFALITQQLGIPLGSSPTISGTLSGPVLTLTVGSPGPLPLSLPAGVPAPVFGPTTVTVDESTNTITLNASATAGVTATLAVTIANAATTNLTNGGDLTATLTMNGVPFVGGTTVSLAGTLSYTGGSLGASLTGSLAAALPIAGGAVILQPGDSVAIATGTGLVVNGTALIGTAAAPYSIGVNGTLTDLKNWSLSVTTTPGQAWQPLPGLTVYPHFSAAITDVAGTVSFDLSSTGTGSWTPGTGATLTATGFEVSNQPPPGTASCPGVATGDVWIDVRGSFSYTPSGMAPLTAAGCADLTSRSFQIRTTAPGTLLPGNPTFNLTNASLTATGSITAKTFTVTGSATVAVTVPGGGSVANLTAAVSFGTGGVLAGVEIPDLRALSTSLSGSGVIYISSTQIAHFKPSDYGLTGGPFPATLPLRAGVNVAYSYTTRNLPANVAGVLGNLHLTIPAGTTILAVAQVSTSGLAASLDVNFGAGAGGARLFSLNGSAFFLDDVTLGLAVGQNSSVSLSGAGYLELPAMWSGGAASQVEVIVTASLDVSTLSPVITVDLANWTNAFGVPGLSVKDLAGSFAVSENPSVSLSADQVTLPTGWPQAIGLAAGAQITMDTTISLTQPLINFSITPGVPGGVALTPLAVGYASQISAGIPLTSDQQTVVNSLQIFSAGFYLAPFGGTTASGLTIQPGLAVSFSALVDHVAVNVEGAVGVAPPSLSVNVSVGSYRIGPVTVGAARFLMDLSPTQLKFGFSGGFSYGGDSYTGRVDLALGSTANGASISFNLQSGPQSGLPNYLTVSATLQGGVRGDGTDAQLAASAWGGFTVNGAQFGSIEFSLTLPGGLNWADHIDSIGTLVWYFIQDGASYQLIMNGLQSIGYSQYEIFNALSNAGYYGAQLLSTLESVFNPFSTTYYDIWTGTSSGQLLVLDVQGGSQSPNAQIETWTWNNGYNQDWAFVPYPNSQGWYEVVNRGSGQCLSIYGNVNAAGSRLVQYPCIGTVYQLWYFGNINLNTYYRPTNGQSGLNMDVQGAYGWPGGTMDQWYANGGGNQQFWLTNSGN
jgi:hypothetical protein